MMEILAAPTLQSSHKTYTTKYKHLYAELLVFVIVLTTVSKDES